MPTSVALGNHFETFVRDHLRIGIASLIWSASILLSRVIALVRAAAIGRVLGTSGDADVYFVAFVLPDFLNYLLAGGALSLVFIPIFGAYLARFFLGFAYYLGPIVLTMVVVYFVKKYILNR